ncbi:uncharacterized protein LOC108106414 [Drosophila eugracilis]|uniref:uncharacterized protein LOC108106414 n=1 Tax=Drosophila eugracilis TaxID=29029 RepID=UPI0007E87DC9|nr:uncharacterized protein LOC108106414 [Drosophila eugracilis]XP_017068926.1 uncharacterized protein LOC108106414 [Drosophila eugracilis]
MSEQVHLSAQGRTQGPPTLDLLRCDGFQIWAEIWIGERKANGVVATGTSMSAISKNKYEELRSQGRWSKTVEELTLANGTSQKAVGDFTTTIRFAGEEFELMFLILDQVQGGILLGMDFLAKTRTVLHCGNLELNITEPLKTFKQEESEHTEEGAEPIEEENQTFPEKEDTKECGMITNDMGWTVPADAIISAQAVKEIIEAGQRKKIGKKKSILLKDKDETWSVLFGRGRRVTVKRFKRQRQPSPTAVTTEMDPHSVNQVGSARCSRQHPPHPPVVGSPLGRPKSLFSTAYIPEVRDRNPALPRTPSHASRALKRTLHNRKPYYTEGRYPMATTNHGTHL